MLSTRNLFTAYPRAVLVAATAFCAAMVAIPAAAQFTVGKDYNIVNPPQSTPDDTKIEVLEFFAYGCGACAALEPKLEAWAKRQLPDVAFRRVPAASAGLNLRGINNVPLYYTLEVMGLVPKLHEKVFEAANRDGVILASASDQNKWLAKQGVDTKVFEATQKSFTVDAKIKGAGKLADQYKISSTPTMVVGGKFISAQTQGPDHFLAVIDSLIAQARSSMKRPVVSASSAPAVAAAAVVGAGAAVAVAVKKTATKPKAVVPKAATAASAPAVVAQ